MLTHLKVKKLYEDARIPTRGTDQAIGLDLYAYFPEPQSGRMYDSLLESQQRKRTVYYGEVARINTGIAVAIPDGYYGRIAPRSGLAAKFGIDVLAGVIDEDYRGELVVLLTVSSRSAIPFTINHGDRIAQLILERADKLPIEVVDSLDTTDRGGGGFGSTGRN